MSPPTQRSVRTALRTLAAGLIAVTAAATLAAEPAARKPNIVYMMADELGYYELSCLGHPHLKTPNIDRLAAEGVRFTQALAGSSLCAPTRGALMTGKHTGHTSVRTNGGGTPLRAGEETIASVLKKVGYATGGFGKWGCGGRGSTGVPEKHGFDVFVGYYDQVHAHSYYPPYIVRNSEELPLAGNAGGRSGQTYSHYVVFDHAKRFIREHEDRPFFCYLPVTPPHGMFDIPEHDPAWALYKDKPWPDDAKSYAAMVNMVDRNVGELRALLEELGLERDTIIFFSGDNGGVDYFRSAERPRGFHAPNVDPRTGAQFRGHKGNLYEGGLRVPMVAWWPGKIAPGRVSDHLWYFPDVLPTVAELAGAPTPADIDGISIVPELLGAAAAGREQERHEYLYWELGGQTAVRAAQWKAVRPRANRPWELYDLSRDRGETTDVARDNPQVLARLEGYAKAAHEPVREGVFHDREIHEKDRRAKWGGRPPARRGRAGSVERIPERGLIPTDAWKIVSVSSESAFNGKVARNAIDGDPLTHWHTAFRDGVKEHPHELVIDLGAEHTIRGFRYLARQDAGWNGALERCEIFVGESADTIDALAAKATFEKTKKAQEVKCAPVRARFVRLRILSSQDDGPWASIAEFAVVGK